MMSVRPNRTLAGAIALLTVAALAGGCSGLPVTPGAGNKSAAGSTVTLTVQTWSGVATEIVANLDAEFIAKHPNVKITLKDGDGSQTLLDGVDVILTGDSELTTLVNGKLVKDLTGLTLPPADDAAAGIFAEMGRVGGKRYGVPVALNPSFMLVNQKSLKAAGIQAPTADWTWQDFLGLLTAAKAAGMQSEVSLGAVAESLVRSYGGQIYDADTQQFTFDTPEAKQGLSALQMFVKNGVVSTDLTGGVRVAPAPTNGAAQGGSAGQGPAFVALNGNMYKSNLVLQTLPYPKGPKGRPGKVTGTVAAVSAASLNDALATEYVKDLLADPAEQFALAGGGVRPVTNDAKALAAWRQAVGDAEAGVFEAALQDGYLFQPIPRQADVLRGLTPCLEGKVPLEPTISTLVSDLNK